MREIRLVGRGGQGVVTAGELLGAAALLDGRQAQSIPTFGPERRGAPSFATLRIDDYEILLKCSGGSPDVLLVLDSTAWRSFAVLADLSPRATLVVNNHSRASVLGAELDAMRPGIASSWDVWTVDATGIAIEVLGRPITNTAMMGALVGATGVVRMESVERVLLQRFGKRGEANVAAARAARDRLDRAPGPRRSEA